MSLFDLVVIINNNTENFSRKVKIVAQHIYGKKNLSVEKYTNIYI